MIDKSQQVQLKKLLSEAVLLLCRNGLPIDSEFSIEAMIGITLSEDKVFLISFHETVPPVSTEDSCELLLTERAERIATVSHSDRRKNRRNTTWTGSSMDISKPTRQIGNAEDNDNLVEEMDGGGFCGDSGLGSFRRDIVIKSEVDYCVVENSSDSVVQNAELSHVRNNEVCGGGEFEREMKSELDGYRFQGSAWNTNSSLPVIDTESVISLRRKPMSSPSSQWLPTGHKGQARGQTLQRQRGLVNRVLVLFKVLV